MQRLRSYQAIPAHYMLITVWVLAMISVPVLRWTGGDAILPVASSVTVLLQAGATTAVLAFGWGIQRTLIIAAGVMVLAWLVEYVGSATGIPFGAYRYTDKLQPQLEGVPLVIPLAWLMMLPAGWAVARAITGRPETSSRRIAFVGLAALAFSAWDLFLDPQMVTWGFWTWANPGSENSYFGIPWTNFGGWLLASALITALVQPFTPAILPVRPLLLIYGIMWILQTIGLLVFWGLPGPALAGFVPMGCLLLVALWREYRPGT